MACSQTGVLTGFTVSVYFLPDDMDDAMCVRLLLQLQGGLPRVSLPDGFTLRMFGLQARRSSW